MILINLAGGPGSGKSTVAAFLFAKLKMVGIKAELVGEEAKEIVYDRLHPLFENQVLIAGLQWQRILRLKNSGCDVAISDSPMIQATMYTEQLPYHEELKALIEKLEKQIPKTYNVYVGRAKPYSQFGRYQTEQEAKALDERIVRLIPEFWECILGNEVGVEHLVGRVISELNS